MTESKELIFKTIANWFEQQQPFGYFKLEDSGEAVIDKSVRLDDLAQTLEVALLSHRSQLDAVAEAKLTVARDAVVAALGLALKTDACQMVAYFKKALRQIDKPGDWDV